MRFLASDGSKFAVAVATTDVVRSFVVVVNIRRKTRRAPRQGKRCVVCAHQSQDRRTNEKEKGNEGRNGISRQTENRAFTCPTKEKGLSRLNGYSPKIECRADSR